MKDINILAIQEGHNATAGLLQNGKIIAVISEERFTRIKNCSDFPLKSVNWLLKYAKITAQDLDAVAFCGKSVILPLSKSMSLEPKVSLIRRIYGIMEYKNNFLFKPIIALKKLFDQNQFHRTLEIGKAVLWKEFRIPSNKIYFVDHHTCHAFSSYFGQISQNQKSIILTLDGEGDDSCSTVSFGLKKKIRRIASTPNAHSLGYIYSITTKFGV